MITSVEPWVYVVLVPVAVLLVFLKGRLRRRMWEAAAERRRSGRPPSAAGSAVAAAFCIGGAVLVLVLDGDDDGRRGLPDWLTVPLLIAGGLYFAGVAVRSWKRQQNDAGRPSGGGTA